MNAITAYAYSGYSQAKNQMLQYEQAAQQQQQPKPQQEFDTAKYKDKVSFSGAKDNLMDFFLRNEKIVLPGDTPEQSLKRNETEIGRQLVGLIRSLGIDVDKKFAVKQDRSDSTVQLKVEGDLTIEQQKRLQQTLNTDERFQKRFNTTEQLTQLSVSLAKAKLRMESFAKDGVAPQYQELQKIKEEIEQLFMAVSISDGRVEFNLVD